MTEERLPQVLARIPNEWGKALRFGPGWDELVAKLDADLAELNPDYVVHQAKEKFGVLEYYISLDGHTPEVANEMYRLVHEARAKSERICEMCGQEGQLVSIGGWLSTLCGRCEASHIQAREERRRQLSRPE